MARAGSASSALTPVCYYVRCEHADLPRDAGVARCCVDLLLTGRSEPRRPPRPGTRSPRPTCSASLEIGDSELGVYPEHIERQMLSAEERGSYFNQLNLAPALYQRLR